MLKIGDVILNSNVVLAPMAGVTNSAFKQIVRGQSDCLLCTEMVNDKAIIHGNEKTLKMVEIQTGEHPVAVQLFGSEVDSMVKAAKYLDKHTTADIIDINMGCPAPKITKNMAGSKILQNSELLFDILKSVVEACDKPVTVKMRLGWDENSINIVENAILAEKAGVAAIFIHGRTTKQFYSGTANWEYIKEVKKHVKIPVIGNGDIDSPEKAKKLMEYSNVDGVMVGRAALGNPFIIKSIEEYLKTGELIEEPTIHERVQLAIDHLDKLILLLGEHIAVLQMRSHASWYVKGIYGATDIKKYIQNCTTRQELVDVLGRLL